MAGDVYRSLIAYHILYQNMLPDQQAANHMLNILQTLPNTGQV